ncbi:MAG: hypothetical protein ACTHJQ_27250 [Rhizobiaceae bacterium]
MAGEQRRNADYRGLALWAAKFAVCAAVIYGVTIWLIFRLLD